MDHVASLAFWSTALLAGFLVALLFAAEMLRDKMFKGSDELQHISINQDMSCIAVASNSTYKIYNIDPFGRCYTKDEQGVGLVEMLFCTSLIALAGSGHESTFSPRRLQIINTKRQSIICELSFPSTVLAVKMNRKRLVVVLADEILIYDISNMKQVHTIRTAPNPAAIAALSTSSEAPYLAYPAPSTAQDGFDPPAIGSAAGGTPTTPQRPAISSPSGEVLLLDTLTLSTPLLIPAHKSPLACLALSADGSLLATASDKGTIIRIFAVPSGEPMAQFRRGTYGAKILDMRFDLQGKLLAVSSDSDTIHIFKVPPVAPLSSTFATEPASLEPEPTPESSPVSERSKRPSLSSLLGQRSLSNIRTSAEGFLPQTITSMIKPQRDFAFLKIPNDKLSKRGAQPLVAIRGAKVIVILQEGQFYEYSLNLENGGECKLEVKRRQVCSKWHLQTDQLSVQDTAEESRGDLL